LLKRHYELVRELKTFEKIAVDELSIEDISYYLKLRREYEESREQIVNLIPKKLENVKKMIDQSGERLDEIFLMTDSITGNDLNCNRYDFMYELIENLGLLETSVEQMTAECLRLLKLLDNELSRTTPEIVPLDNHSAASFPIDMLSEVACAVVQVQKPIAEANSEELKATQKKNAAVKDIIKGEEAGNDKIKVSPATIKKLEMMVRPKSATENIVKIGTAPEAKSQPAKSSKDRPKSVERQTAGGRNCKIK